MIAEKTAMTTIALFGASGQTGSIVLKKAIEKGFRVKALVRNPAKVSVQHPNLEIIRGDVLNSSDVEKTLENSQVVISLFGHVKGSPVWLQTDGTRLIVDAMKKFQIKRIISLSGGGLPFPERDRPKLPDLLIRFIMKVAVPKVLNDAVKHHEILKGSGLDWTIVRGPRLTNDPPKRKYRVGWVGVNASTKISRHDLADFILTQIDDASFIGQMPFVTD